ncbi:hypothetical protein Tco_0544590, partial [Tanacetum coccineum]
LIADLSRDSLDLFIEVLEMPGDEESNNSLEMKNLIIPALCRAPFIQVFAKGCKILRFASQ